MKTSTKSWPGCRRLITTNARLNRFWNNPTSLWSNSQIFPPKQFFKLYPFLEFITPTKEALKARSIYLSIFLMIFQRGDSGVQGQGIASESAHRGESVAGFLGDSQHLFGRQEFEPS